MTIIRAIISGLLVLFAAYAMVLNWSIVAVSISNCRKGVDKHLSMISGMSLIIAAIAYPLYPFGTKWWIVAIPILDPGTWMLLIGLPWAIAHGAFKSKPDNLDDGGAE